jgi:hypothetical protein
MPTPLYATVEDGSSVHFHEHAVSGHDGPPARPTTQRMPATAAARKRRWCVKRYSLQR